MDGRCKLLRGFGDGGRQSELGGIDPTAWLVLAPITSGRCVPSL